MMESKSLTHIIQICNKNEICIYKVLKDSFDNPKLFSTYLFYGASCKAPKTPLPQYTSILCEAIDNNSNHIVDMILKKDCDLMKTFYRYGDALERAVYSNNTYIFKRVLDSYREKIPNYKDDKITKLIFNNDNAEMARLYFAYDKEREEETK